MIPPIQASKQVESVRAPQASSGAQRVGNVVEATVISVGPNGQAQLSVNGSPLNIRSVAPLVPGSSVALVVNPGVDGGVVLKLLAPEAASGPAPATVQVSASTVSKGTQTLQGALIGLGDTLGSAKSSLSSSLSSSGSTSSNASTQAGGSPSRDIAALARHIDIHASATRQPADFTGASGASNAGSGSGLANSDGGSGASAFSRGASAPVDLNGAAAASSATVHTLALPGMGAPVQLAITHEDGRRAASQGSSAQSNAVTARFTVVSDRLGPVHAVLRQVDGAISVGLWAERRESATALQQDRGVLNSKLRDADISVGVLEIHSGRPEG